MSGGPLRQPGFANAVSRKDTPSQVRRSARGGVTGKKREITTIDTETRVQQLESELLAIKAALKAAGLMT